MRVRVKICCIRSLEEADCAIAAGADAIGLVGPMPSGPGIIDLDLAAAIARRVPPPIASVLLSPATALCELVEQIARVAPAAVQLVSDVPPAFRLALRDRFPALRIIQVVHVGSAAIGQAGRATQGAHALLLDSGRPEAPVPELGGTGRIHDWRVSRDIVAAVDRPVFLAGGLRPGNVAQAIRAVAPFGVDVCSGVRSDGALDPTALRAFLEQVRSSGGAPT